MVAQAERLTYEPLARVAAQLAGGIALQPALELIAEATAEATGADVAVVRVRDAHAGGAFVARAVAPADSPSAAELSGSVADDGAGALAGAVTVAAQASAGDNVLGAVEAYRRGDDFDPETQALVDLAAAQLALALRLGPQGADGANSAPRLARLAREGEALAAGAELDRAARQTVKLAAEATRAQGAAIWQARGEQLDLLTLDGEWTDAALEEARALALRTRAGEVPLLVEPDAGGTGSTVSIRLGQPAFGVLQLAFGPRPLDTPEIEALAAFAARAAHALRLGARAHELELELSRTRALLSLVGEAIARLSVAHTLETAVERISELLSIDRVGIFLLEGGRPLAAAGHDLSADDEDVAQALLDLALGPLRARETIEVRARGEETVAAAAVRTLRRVGVESVLAVPLRFQDEPIGLLLAYPRTRRPTEGERSLLASLATQLAVVVQNARLHERATELGEALSAVLDSERAAANRLRALYAISSSFASSLSLDTTLATVTRAVVELLNVDAAVIRIPDDRGETMVAASVHVADDRLNAAVRTILDRPQPAVRVTRPLALTPEAARRLGGAHALLAPFLEAGSTAVVLPIETQVEVLAVLTILSLDPAAPISSETVETAATIAAQAALAIDNARLYQQQKQFAETIQRALLPSERPDVPGLEVGTVYESAARLDVGGDVYDFLELPDGRLAVVLGDVTGHGVDATADMAMAKFVFRSLAREHAEPGDFLAAANDVITDEIALGKFITMVYVALDPSGAVTSASAGHPPPRLVLPDGRVEALECSGLALGIARAQEYAQVRAELPPGAAVVLYTDGVVEARRDGELFGTDRLDAYLSDHRALPPEQLARGLVAACRAFAGGDASDDCAVVIARKT